MKIYAVVDIYDVDGIWITEAESTDILFASLELAEAYKNQNDAKELEEHRARESKRYERFTRMNAARAILEANNFEGVDEAMPYSYKGTEFVPYEHKSKTHIIVLEVRE